MTKKKDEYTVQIQNQCLLFYDSLLAGSKGHLGHSYSRCLSRIDIHLGSICGKPCIVLRPSCCSTFTTRIRRWDD